MRNKGYALRMSKSSDSITAAKLLVEQRMAKETQRPLRINQNMSKSIEKQIDVYTKTREDIRRILQLAKTCSVAERVKLLDTNSCDKSVEDTRETKAEAIRREIMEAKGQSRKQSRLRLNLRSMWNSNLRSNPR